MFDHLTLDELEEWRAKLTQFMLTNLGVQSFSMPDGVSMNVNKDNAWKYLEEVRQAIKRKLGHGGRFRGAAIR